MLPRKTITASVVKPNFFFDFLCIRKVSGILIKNVENNANDFILVINTNVTEN